MKNFVEKLGTVTAIIGSQWGDEAKGKITDIVTEHADVIARASGGANAGHTVYVDGRKYAFQILPSGCLHLDRQVVLGAGMAICLETLMSEIEALQADEINILSHLHISHAAHIVFDFHKLIDAKKEEWRKQIRGSSLGTTKRGIGPTYTSKALRSNLRMECLLWSEQVLKEELLLLEKEIEEIYDVEVDVQKELQTLLLAKRVFSKSISTSIPSLLQQYVFDGKKIIIEGAQATLLDLDHGTYPHVTSSSTTVAGALQGLGIAPKYLTSCIGVTKAYCTRVGSGEFLTEADSDASNRIQEKGKEYGVNTKRPRRCGWLFLPDLHYAAMINGFTFWNLTKLDVLDEEVTIPVGIGQDVDGSVLYEQLPGWQCSTAGIHVYEDLPEQAKSFIQFIEEQTEIPVGLIGTGPNRKDMIVRQ